MQEFQELYKTKEEYRKLVNKFIEKSSDGKVSAGKFEGDPEISFHVSSKEEAINLAKEYNQISVWDWKGQFPIDTNGTGMQSSYKDGDKLWWKE